MEETEEQSNIEATTIKPVDWGVAFALSHQRILLSFALLPALGEVIIAYMRFSYPLSPQSEFLSSVCATALNAWLLSVVAMACISSTRGEALKIFKLSSRALKGLPKVFFSFIGLNTLFVLFALLPPLLLVMILFIWAPLFCIGEQYVEQPEEPDDDEDDDEDVYVRRKESKAKASFFKNKSIFELGFARAAQLGIRNMSSALQIGLLIWCAKFLPFSVVGLLLPESTGFFVEFIVIALSAWTDVLVIAVTAGTFIFLLSRESQDEIGVLADEGTLKQIGGKQRIRMQGNFWVTAVLAIVALCSTTLVFYQIKNTNLVPSTLIAEVRSTEIKDGNFNVKIFLSDMEDRFRWLDVQKLRASFPGKEGIGLAMEGKEDKEIVSIPLKTFNVRASDGKEIHEGDFTPIDGPLTLSLTFEAPKDLPEKGQFVLYYSTFFREPEKVFEGRYGSW